MSMVFCVAGGVLLAELVAVAIGCAIGSILYLNNETKPAPKDTPSRRGKVIDAAHLALGANYDERRANSVSMMNAGAWTYEMLPDGHPLKAAGLAAKAAICRSDDDAMTFDASLISSISISIGEDLGVIVEDGESLGLERARLAAREWWPNLTDAGFETALTTDRLNRISWRA